LTLQEMRVSLYGGKKKKTPEQVKYSQSYYHDDTCANHEMHRFHCHNEMMVAIELVREDA
jgi:hypothetical protein